MAEQKHPLTPQERQQKAVESLEHGHLPPSAKHRLKGLAQDFQKHGTFFSTLGPAESLLAGNAGVEPVGVVVGSSVFKFSLKDRTVFALFNGVGFLRSTGEMEKYTAAHLDARRRAFHRLRSEAALLGAHGVIDVQFEQQVFGLTDGCLQFKTSGTAVRLPGLPPPTSPEDVFTSDVSGQDFWKLHQAGSKPLEVVYGVSCYWVRASWNTISLERNRWRGNQEVPQLTECLLHARRLAMQRMQAHGRRIGANDIVGANVACELVPFERSQNVQDVLIIYFARGTAIQHGQPLPTQQARPLMMLDLATGKERSLDLDGSTGGVDFDSDPAAILLRRLRADFN